MYSSGKEAFSGATRLEILGIVVDTKAQQVLLQPKKMMKISSSARALLM